HLRLAVRDRQLRRQLTPDYRLGCKRLLTSSTFYQALSQPHVRLHPNAVSAVRGNEVVGADGTTVPTDVLIEATGFRVGELPLAKGLYGTNGRTLDEAWSGEPQAYMGTTVSGFPNLFLLLGPNLLGGSTSAITVLEAQLTYLIAALAHLDQGGHRALDVRSAAQAAHNTAVHGLQHGRLHQLLLHFHRAEHLRLAMVHRAARAPTEPIRRRRLHLRRTCPAPSPARSDKGSRERRAAMTWCPMPRPHHWELHDHLLPGTGPVRSLPTG
ncbi:hypothetical protein ACFVRU_11160, partial [Streptomyces sp. NPDC057927]